MKKSMNYLKIIFSLLVIIQSFGICFSQNMALLTVKSLAFKENVEVMITSGGGYKDSTFIHNCSFRFLVPATKGDSYFMFFPKESKSINYPVFIKEHSETHIELDSTLSNPEISGDQLALEQNDFWKQANLNSQKYRMIDKEIGQTNDSLKLL
jgi:hypothetical protein